MRTQPTPEVDPAAIFEGSREPSIDAKWAARNVAWANGARPAQTEHHLVIGDARELPMEPSDIHLVVTSPPYFDLVDYRGAGGVAQLGAMDDYDAFLDELDLVWERCFGRLVPGGRMCVVVGDVCIPRRRSGRHHVLPLHADIATRCRRLGFDYLTPIIWSKIANATTEVSGSSRFLGKPYEPNGVIKNDIEYVLMLRKPGGYRKPSPKQRALSILDRTSHDTGYRSVWTDIRGENRANGHPAPFPAPLAERLTRLFSFVGDTVLDPFMGTGSTAVAAARAARNSIGYDVGKSYIEHARSRMQSELFDVPARITIGEG